MRLQHSELTVTQDQKDNSMQSDSRCPECGATVPAGTPQDDCPGCLLKIGFAPAHTGSAGESSETKPSALAVKSPDELAPIFPRYEILGLIGVGGMGAVYKARQPQLNRLVALKVMTGQQGDDPSFAERFAREARILASLSHPQIVTIFDFGTAQGTPFLVMEFVDGMSLREALNRGIVTRDDAVWIIPQICQALHHAHAEGIVHRDIKPENVLISNTGEVKVVDFGLAKASQPRPQSFALTEADQRLGTPYYMAPEQMERLDQVDHRADIFAVGVLLYEILTGKVPRGRFESPSSIVAVDSRFDAIINHTLENDPDRRYQSVDELQSHITSITTLPSPEYTLRLRDPATQQITTGEIRIPYQRRSQLILTFGRWVAFGCYVAFFINLVNVSRSRQANGMLHYVGQWIEMRFSTADELKWQIHVFNHRFMFYFVPGLIALFVYRRLSKRQLREHRASLWWLQHLCVWTGMAVTGIAVGLRHRGQLNAPTPDTLGLLAIWGCLTYVVGLLALRVRTWLRPPNKNQTFL
jgi:serine/threonine protein kinase